MEQKAATLFSTSRSAATVDLSVVVVSHNEGERLRQTVDNLRATAPPRSEVIVVDDASSDGSAERLGAQYAGVSVIRPPERLGIAAARNLGAKAARGEILVFCDAHVEAQAGWFPPVQAALQAETVGVAAPAVAVMGSPDAKGYGIRWKDDALNIEWLPRRSDEPYPVPMVSACFMAMRRETFDCVGGFDAGLKLRGFTDTELCLRLWTLGLECVVVPSVAVAHLFRATSPYPVDQRLILHNMLRVGVVHFGEDRLRRLVAALRNERDFAAAYALLTSGGDGDAWARREAVRAARRYDDDWFFRKFSG